MNPKNVVSQVIVNVKADNERFRMVVKQDEKRYIVPTQVIE